MSPVDAAITERLTRFAEATDRACEAALQGGEHGVLIEWDGPHYTISVSSQVPYGFIHEKGSML